MELKPGYKQTEIGVIPEDWDEFALYVVSVKIQDGTHFSPKIGGTKYKYITSKNIGNGSLNLENVDMISEEEHKKIYKRCDVKEGDILLTKDGINTGNAAVNDLKEEFSLLSSVALIRLDSKNYDNRYLMYQILSDIGQARISKMISGNAITRLTLDKIKRMIFPFPTSKHEQMLIADKLSCIDSLITSIEKLIEKKKLIKQGVMQELLTGKRRLPGFSGEWETKRLGDIAYIKKGQQLNSNDFIEHGEFPVMNGGIAPSGFTTTFNTEGHTLIISEGGNSCGFVNYVKHRFWQGGHCYSVSTDQNDIYLYYALKYKENEIMSLRVGSGLPNVQKKRLSEVPVLLPSIDEQAAIAGVLSDYHLEIDILEKRLHKQTLLKQALMQELLTGRIRLI